MRRLETERSSHRSDIHSRQRSETTPGKEREIGYNESRFTPVTEKRGAIKVQGVMPMVGGMER